jgi:hypothetical protein
VAVWSNSTPFRSTSAISALEPGSQRWCATRYAECQSVKLVYIRGSVVAREYVDLVMCVQTTTLVAAVYDFGLSNPAALSLNTIIISLSLVVNSLSREQSLADPTVTVLVHVASTASAAVASSMSHHILNFNYCLACFLCSRPFLLAFEACSASNKSSD